MTSLSVAAAFLILTLPVLTASAQDDGPMVLTPPPKSTAPPPKPKPKPKPAPVAQPAPKPLAAPAAPTNDVAPIDLIPSDTATNGPVEWPLPHLRPDHAGAGTSVAEVPALEPPADATTAPSDQPAAVPVPTLPTISNAEQPQPPPSSEPPGVDLAYGAFQRGYYLSAFGLAIPRAEAGDKAAQTLVGLIFEGGYGVPRDPVQAVSWYGFAADGGDPKAQFALGSMYLEGRGVPSDRAKAADYFEKAAANGKSPPPTIWRSSISKGKSASRT